MKNLVQLAIAATLAVGATANSHQHLHRHAKKQVDSEVEKRTADSVVYVASAVEVVYQLDGKVLDADKAVAGLKDGEYVVVGETTPTYTPPPPPPKSTTTTSSAKNLGAQFVEQPSSSPSPPPPPKTTSSPPPAPKATSVSKPSSPSGGTGLNAQFPSGEIPCSKFPSDYGAIPLKWLNFGGYSGLQFVPNFSLKTSLSISSIITGVTGDKCSPGCMCSYSCPPGYQKTQWSKAQGATKQSIGGLYCNADGFLELTRDGFSTLCEPGAGGVTIKNDLNEVVSTCRTDYPGTENMVLPLEAQPGSTVEVTNPIQDKYYIWDGKGTSAQYYINKKGLSAADSCVWTCAKDPLGCGNWAPAILGVGQAADGITYISIFQNLPTSTAKLDFNIEITGDVTTKCAYSNGNWIGGSNGCTTGMKKGGKAVVRYF